MKLVLFAAAAVLVACPADAGAITQINFIGHGQVTYTDPGETGPPPPVAVGDRVTVKGTVWLGDGPAPPPVPSNFTGDVVLSASDLFAGRRAFTFSVIGGGVGGSSSSEGPFMGGLLSLVDGRLTAISLFVAGETSHNNLRTTSFSGLRGPEDEDPTVWGGTWTLNQPVPEPATWALLLLGFGAAGAELRRRRRAYFTLAQNR